MCTMMIIIYSMIVTGYVQAATHGLNHGAMPCCNGSTDSRMMDLSPHVVPGMVDMINADVAVDESPASSMDHDNDVCADQLGCASCAAGGCGRSISTGPAQTLVTLDQHLDKTWLSVIRSFSPPTETKPPRPFPRSV